MSLSATTVALILTIGSNAYGNPVVIGEVREDVPAAQISIAQASTPKVAAAAPAAQAAAPQAVLPVKAAPTVESADAANEVGEATDAAEPTPEDAALYSRLLGNDAGAAEPDAPAVAQARETVWPWWVWPVGMLTIGVLFLMRGKAREKLLPAQTIRIVSRSAMGKEGTLAVIEVADGDHRTRRLLVGFGGGAPRLVADVSAWDVAVAAPAPQSAAAPHHTGPDPMPAQAAPAQAAPAPVETARPVTFGGALKTAAARYGAQPTAPVEVPVSEAPAREDLVAEVLAMRDTKELSPVKGKRRPAYSRRQVVA